MNKETREYYSHDSAVIDEGAQIGAGSKIWHFSHIMENAKIGKDCSLGQNVFVANNVVIGNQVKVQNNVSIYEGVVCEDYVFLGPSMVFTNVYNPRSGVSRKEEYKKTLVKEGASIGANATIVCGVTLGRFCFVGAGSVVKQDVLDYAMVVGVPAVWKGWMSEYGEKLIFDVENRAVCKHTGAEYLLKDDKVIRV